MLKKWKALDDLECVKKYGLKHKMSHMIGAYSISKCTTAMGELVIEGLLVGLRAPCQITKVGSNG